MITALSLAILLQVFPGPATLTVDLDGNGSAETVTATARAGKIRIEVRSASGARVARAETSAPGPGPADLTLSSGSLGSSGALLEVAATAADRECRSIWRLRGRELSSVPILAAKGALSSCSPREGWTDRWERPRQEAPAEYVRERTRPTADGQHHRTEVYHFAGFSLDLDRERSTAEIAGIAIPDWSPAVLYPKPLIETLLAGFDLAPFKKAPRLRIVTDREEGIFALVFDRSSEEGRLAITSSTSSTSAPGPEKDEWVLIAGSGPSSARVHVRLGSDHRSPVEVAVEGLDRDLNRLYVPVTRKTSRGMEVFASAEDEIALMSLVGLWDNNRGRRINVASVSSAPAVVDFDKDRVALSIARAPEGSDVLLLPRDGSAPKTALLLRGSAVFARLPVACEAGPVSATEGCRIAGPGEIFHRLGSRVNSR